MAPQILVVDDAAVSRTLLERILQAEKYDVLTATDGVSAIEQVTGNHVDLVLLDVQMPKLDGFEVCRRIKTNPLTRLIPVVLVTSLSATDDRIRGLEAGADDFLSKPFDRNELLARVRSLLRLKAYTDELERAESVLFALARSIEAKDPYTEGHCARLAESSVRLGERMGLAEEHLGALRLGGVTHDIGKVAVPDAILLKPGPLTAAERMLMEQHPVVGERICAPLKSFRLVLPIIRHHHERFDGSGYPDGLKGGDIPLTARVLQMVDVYDALVTERPYKAALSSAEALETLAEQVRWGWRDPQVFEKFRAMMVDGNRKRKTENEEQKTTDRETE